MSLNYVIKSNDPEAVTKLQENIKYYEERKAHMKSVNTYYSDKGTIYGCPGVANDYATALEKIVKKQGAPYLPEAFENMDKQIKMLTSMIDRVTNNKESLFKGWEFSGGEAVVNLANSRLQLKFEKKPPNEVIEALKANNFHWARSTSAWQRALTYQTMTVCEHLDFVKPKDGRKISEIQPKKPKKNEPER